MTRIKFLSGFLVVITMACSKPTFYESIQNQQIIVGSGGGFTGDGTEYILKGNGEVNKKKISSDSLIYVTQLDTATTKSLFRKMRRLHLADKTIEEPGNMSKYISYREPKKFQHKATWGNPTFKTPKAMTRFYENFIKLIQ